MGYLCAYFRYYYPLEFITSFLNNAANEEAVYAFLDGKIPFTDIEKEVERALEKIAFDKEKVSLRKILTLDQSTRRYCAKRFERR